MHPAHNMCIRSFFVFYIVSKALNVRKWSCSIIDCRSANNYIGNVIEFLITGSHFCAFINAIFLLTIEVCIQIQVVISPTDLTHSHILWWNLVEEEDARIISLRRKQPARLSSWNRRNRTRSLNDSYEFRRHWMLAETAHITYRRDRAALGNWISSSSRVQCTLCNWEERHRFQPFLDNIRARASDI